MTRSGVVFDLPTTNRGELARRIAIMTPFPAAEIEENLQLLSNAEIAEFLGQGCRRPITEALDLATLRRVAPGIERRTYPSLQLFPLPDKHPIPNGAHRSTRGSNGWYTVCNHGGRLFCDCPSFAFSKEPQTCKHLRGIQPARYDKKG